MFTKTGIKKTKFKLRAPEARNVSLTGDFQSWSSEGIPMRKSWAGVWNVGLDLPPGTYQYKFIVDGDWWTDPKNGHISDSDIGSINSVIKV